MMAVDREQKQYQRNYYEKHRDEINERRRKKYWDFADHREQVKADALARYHAKRVGIDKNANYTIKNVDGVPLFSIQYVARITGKSQETLRDWEKKGIMPQSVYTDSRGWRFYTSSQVESIGTAVKNYSEKMWGIEQVRIFLHTHWDEKRDN